jgi:hypothetical protein
MIAGSVDACEMNRFLCQDVRNVLAGHQAVLRLRMST